MEVSRTFHNLPCKKYKYLHLLSIKIPFLSFLPQGLQVVAATFFGIFSITDTGLYFFVPKKDVEYSGDPFGLAVRLREFII